jgi:cell division septation protein DedD
MHEEKQETTRSVTLINTQATIQAAEKETKPEARLKTSQIENPAKPEKAEIEARSEKTQNTAQTPQPTNMTGAIGDPADSEPEQGNENGQVAIYDNANEETASYSIQVGIFGLLENAERKLEELMAVDLSAYLVEYMNKQSKMRYKVCFGYFADRKSAMNALVIFEKELAGSGYVISLKPKAFRG